VEKHNKFKSYYVDRIYEYEQIIVYFIFRYFMKAVFDYDVSAKIKMAVISMLIIEELDVVRWCKNNEEFNLSNQVDIVKLYSKDIEHSEENVESLYESFETKSIFSLENLLTIINN
ncbi:MAG: flagellar protein FliB, partial [Clostridium sp.]|nr:flagellar protein FliB [Clostridium sp.]